MKLITLKPLFLAGTIVVEGKSFETIEQHGRELITKGYAMLDDSDAEPVVTLAEDPAPFVPAFTSDQLAPTQLDAVAASFGDLQAPPAADAPDAPDLQAPPAADAPDAPDLQAPPAADAPDAPDLLAPPAADAPDAPDLLPPPTADAPDAPQKPVSSKKKAS
jgi:hypothetical protein